MTIYSIDGEFYLDYDLALLKTLGTHLVVKSHEVNTTTGLEAHNFEKENVVVAADDEEFNVDFEMREVYHDEWEAYDISVEGVEIEKSGLSEEFKKDIINECELIADKRNR